MCDIATHENGKCPAILTNDGVPYVRPTRADFPAGIDGAIEYIRAVHAINDRIASDASRAFAEQFSRSMRAKKRTK